MRRQGYGGEGEGGERVGVGDPILIKYISFQHGSNFKSNSRYYYMI